MKPFTKLVLTGALLTASSAAAAGQVSIASVERGVANVLVTVGTDGAIKNFSVAEKFKPKIHRLLENTLKGLVVTPSPSSANASVGQVVLRFALESTPIADGKYSIKFVAFDSKPVPSGSWYWTIYDQRQLALVDRNTWQQRRYYREPAPSAPRYQPNYQRQPNTSPPANAAGSTKKR